MRSEPHPEHVVDYVAALIQSSAQIGMIVDQMEQFARRSGGRRTRPTVAILAELIEGILSDPGLRLDLSGIEDSTALLVEATEAIGHNLFFVDPGAADEVP